LLTVREVVTTRQPLFAALCANGEMGADAFHRMEEELDWLEMAGDSKGE
jgi:hypothetical protein